MKKIILAGIIFIQILSAENITIENLNNKAFAIVGKFQLTTRPGTSITYRNFKKIKKENTLIYLRSGILKNNKTYLKKKKMNHLHKIQICFAEKNNKGRWHKNICSNSLQINKDIFYEETLTIEPSTFIINRKKEKNEWYLIMLTCGDGKGWCYIHHEDRYKINNHDTNSKEFYKSKYEECKIQLEVK